MKDLKIKIEMKDPRSLTPYVKNAKIHSPEQIDQLAGIIAAFGFDQPIVVDPHGVIIKGHGRREAAIKLGLARVPVIVSPLDEYEAMAARLADNKVTSTDYEIDKLKFDLGTLQRQDFNLQLTAFSLKEIEELVLPIDEVKMGETIGGPPPANPPEEQPEPAPVKDLPPQYIVSVHCQDEGEMQELYEELKGRGLECKLIT